MFTGIIEAIGKVASVEERGAIERFAIEAPGVTEGVRVGDSVSVNGTCLTVVEATPAVLAFEAIRETLLKTSLAGLQVGSRVNLERAMRADARLDGHIVQGHVDDTGRVARLERDGEDVRFYVECSEAFADLLVEKGSVAIDGVSLTVVGVRRDGFDAALIPHTLDVTTLGERKPGDPVNLEADVLGKYVQKYLERVMGTTDRGRS